MKLAIIYSSVHHGNTEKLVQSIAKKNPDIKLIDSTKAVMMDLSKYDYVGFASGIYHKKFHKTITTFIQDNLPENKKVFVLYTFSKEDSDILLNIKKLFAAKSAIILGIYSCKGYDSHGFLKFIGGKNKNHPNEEEILGANAFIEQILNN